MAQGRFVFMSFKQKDNGTMAQPDSKRKALRFAFIAVFLAAVGGLMIMHRPSYPGAMAIVLVILVPVFWSLACGTQAAAKGYNRTLWSLLGASFQLLGFMFLFMRPQRKESFEPETLRRLRYKRKIK